MVYDCTWSGVLGVRIISKFRHPMMPGFAKAFISPRLVY
jgi:hypothetical protein